MLDAHLRRCLDKDHPNAKVLNPITLSIGIEVLTPGPLSIAIDIEVLIRLRNPDRGTRCALLPFWAGFEEPEENFAFFALPKRFFQGNFRF